MNLRELEIFCTVCEEKSVTRAAERLCMTQPAVSHVIKALEAETGSRLFDRLARRICLTGAGGVLLEKAIPVLEAFAELREEMAQAEDRAPLRLGSSITIANTWLPGVIREFKARRADIPVTIRVESAAAVERRLAANELDLAFIEGDIGGSSWETSCISSYRMTFFCSGEHPFAGRRGVSAEELTGQELALREKGSAIRDALDSALRLRHLAAEPSWTSTNSQALIQVVKRNLAVSLLPESLLENEFRGGALRPFHVKGMELSNRNNIVSHRDKHWTAAMRELADIAKEAQDIGASLESL